MLQKNSNSNPNHVIERIQTGVRMEKKMIKVLKAIAEYHEISLGDLLEGIVLYAFEGKSPFQDESINLISEFKKLYKMDYGSEAAHNLIEKDNLHEG